MNQLEQEAKEFLQKKTPAEEPDVESFRFYLGVALSGYLSGGLTRPEEVLNKAAELAVLAQQKEKEYSGS